MTHFVMGAKWEERVLRHTEVAREASKRYQAWKARQKRTVTPREGTKKYQSIYRQVLKQFMKEGTI